MNSFYSAFLNIHRSGVLTALAWLVPRICCQRESVSARSVYTIQPCTVSLHAKPPTQGVCVFSCNLPPALLAEWPGSFTCYCSNTGVERIPKWVMCCCVEFVLNMSARHLGTWSPTSSTEEVIFDLVSSNLSSFWQHGSVRVTSLQDTYDRVFGRLYAFAKIISLSFSSSCFRPPTSPIMPSDSCRKFRFIIVSLGRLWRQSNDVNSLYSFYRSAVGTCLFEVRIFYSFDVTSLFYVCIALGL